MDDIDILFCNQLDVNKINISKRKGNKIMLSYDYDNNGLYLQTPKFRVPFEIKDKVSQKTNQVFMKQISFSTELHKNNQYVKENKHISKFSNTLVKIDQRIRKLLPEYNDYEMYKSLYHGNNDFSPIFNVNMVFFYGTTDLDVDIFDKDKNEILHEELNTKNAIVSSIVKLDSVWVSNGKMGVNWIANQIQIHDYCNKIPISEDNKQKYAIINEN